MQPAEDTSELVDALVGNHRRFLGFLERRVGSRETAEEILQEAFVRGIERAGSVRERESAVAWFYRLLRNAVIDHYRTSASARRTLAAAAAEWEAMHEADPETRQAICQCVRDLASTLKPDYAEALQRVDVEGVAVGSFADDAGITTNNAYVRLHRAREALRRRVRDSCGTCAAHGCVDCDCRR